MNNECHKCHTPLSQDEVSSGKITNEYICNKCYSARRLQRKIKEIYDHKLKSVDARYRDIRYDLKKLTPALINKNIIMVSLYTKDSSRQFAWDIVKAHWLNDKNAAYNQAQRISAKYRTCQWSEKESFAGDRERYAGTLVLDNMLGDNVDGSFMSRLVSQRLIKEHPTVLVAHKDPKSVELVPGHNQDDHLVRVVAIALTELFGVIGADAQELMSSSAVALWQSTSPEIKHMELE